MITPATTSCWPVYRPTEKCPWDVRRVQRLHRRAGFGATWSEIQRDLRRGPKLSIDALLRGAEPGVPGFESRQTRLAEAASLTQRPEQLQAWWVYRMLYGGHPLRERLVLLWHDHFATSQQKVKSVPLMRRQNEIFRSLAFAPFGELLTAVVKDPALLIYLDAPANKNNKINENLGRELFELFTIGIGHYGEQDVREASRALTGWSIDGDQKFVFRREDHDTGTKTVLGKTGKFDGDDLLKMALRHPSTARTIANRLCEEFLGEGTPDDALAALASGLREQRLRIDWAVSTILRSERFHASNGVGSRFLGPVEYIIGAVHALECSSRMPSTLELATWITRAGQKLFFPQNVGGWQGGRAWFTQRDVLTRANFADALIRGRVAGLGGPVDILELAKRHQAGSTPSAIGAFLCSLLLGYDDPPWIDRDPGAEGWTAADARRLATVILSSPDAQLS